MSFRPGRIERFLTDEGRSTALFHWLVIVLAGLAAYATTFTMTFNFDDTSNILGNPTIRNFSALGFGPLLRSSRAVGNLSFLLNYQLHGTSVFGYHLLNLLIHLASALLLYWLVILLGRAWPWPATVPGDGTRLNLTPVALWAALLFVVHPVQTQAVTYIVQRFTSLATCFYLAAVCCYCSARLAQVRKEPGSRRAVIVWFSLSLVAVLLAMRTKEIAFTVPFAILLVELLFFPGKLRHRLAMAGAFLATLVVIPLTLIGTKGSLGEMIAALDGVTKVQTIMGRADYLFTQFRVIVTYLRLLLWPVNQNLDYDYPVFHTFLTPPVYLSFLLLLSLMLLGLFLLFKSRRGGSGAPWQRLIAFGIFWFFLALAVESSFIPIIDVIFEHRVYLPSAGFFIAAAAAMEWLRLSLRGRQSLVWVTAAVVVLVLAVATVRRNQVWQNEISLWSDVCAKSPNNPRPWNNLGYAYLKHNEPYQALGPLLRSVKLNPSHPDAWNNIGIALDQLGRYRGRFQRTTQTFSDPRSMNSKALTDWFGKAYNNAGLASEIMQRYPQAARYYQQAIAMNPGLGEAYYNLGLVYLAAGNRPQAELQLQMLSFVNPQLAAMLRQRLSAR